MTGPLAYGLALAAVIGRSEPDLVGFVWLVGFVLTGFLVLARVSQRAVDDAADGPGGVTREPRPPAPPQAPASGQAVEREVDDEATPEPDAATAPVAHPLAPEGAVGSSPEDASDPPLDSATERSAHRADQAADVTSRPAVGEGAPLSPGMLLLNVALTQGVFGALVAGGVWYFGVPPGALGISPASLSTGLPAVLVGVGFGAVLWVGNELASGLASASGADYDEGLRELLAPEGPRAWALLLGATLPVIAVVEELIFRAAVIGATTAAFDTSPWALAAVSAVAFALGHGAQGRVGVVVTGALGLALAAGFVLTNSLLVVVVAHYLVNALEFLVHEGLGLPDPVWSSGRDGTV